MPVASKIMKIGDFLDFYQLTRFATPR